MPFMNDLGQMERDFGGEIEPAKKVKKFKKVRLPLSIMGDKLPKKGEMIVAVVVGPMIGFEDTEHSQEMTVEAQKGGIYMNVSGDLKSRLTKAFEKRMKTDG